MGLSLFFFFLLALSLSESKNIVFFSKDGEIETNLNFVQNSAPYSVEATISVEQLIETYKAQGGLGFPLGMDDEFLAKLNMNTLLMSKEINIAFLFPNSRTINDNTEVYFIESDTFCYNHLYNRPIKVDLTDMPLKYSDPEALEESVNTRFEEISQYLKPIQQENLDLGVLETSEQAEELTSAIIESSVKNPSLLQPIIEQFVGLENEKSLVNAAKRFSTLKTKKSNFVKFYSNPREEIALKYTNNLLVTELNGKVKPLFKDFSSFFGFLENRATVSTT
jgi:hypothetical protein